MQVRPRALAVVVEDSEGLEAVEASVAAAVLSVVVEDSEVDSVAASVVLEALPELALDLELPDSSPSLQYPPTHSQTLRRLVESSLL